MKNALIEKHISENPEHYDGYEYEYSPKWIWAKERDNIGLLTQAKGFNGAAIGFGIIAGTSLISLTLLVNSRGFQQKND